MKGSALVPICSLPATFFRYHRMSETTTLDWQGWPAAHEDASGSQSGDSRESTMALDIKV